MNTAPVLVDVAVKDLSGAALDWAVAQAENVPLDPALGVFKGAQCVMHATYRVRAYKPFRPSTDWNQGGPLIENYAITLTPFSMTFNGPPNYWTAEPWVEGALPAYGTTALTAACRAVVAAKLGDIAKVPACLVMP